MNRWISPLLYWSGAYRRRWLVRRDHRVGLVLTYHRIGPASTRVAPSGFGVEVGLPVDIFEAQLRFVLRHCRPVRVGELCDPERLPTEPVFTVTFDDGYADNLALAAPVLSELNVPATIYLSSDFIGSERLFWWEQLGEMLRQTRSPRLPLAGLECGTTGRQAPADSTPLRTRRQKANAHHRLSTVLMRMPPDSISNALKNLSEVLEVCVPEEGRSAPLLTWDQVRAWVRLGFDIGAHTRSHANLALTDDLANEVGGSVATISSHIDKAVPTFAYPYGGPEHRSEGAMRAIKDAGCIAAFTTDLGAIQPGCDPMALPRTGLTRRHAIVCAHQLELSLAASNTTTQTSPRSY